MILTDEQIALAIRCPDCARREVIVHRYDSFAELFRARPEFPDPDYIDPEQIPFINDPCVTVRVLHDPGCPNLVRVLKHLPPNTDELVVYRADFCEHHPMVQRLKELGEL